MTPEDLDKFRKCRILVIGDVMLDHFIWGSVRRISPEAPVPVVEVSKEVYYPGGAANVARNVAPFSAHTVLLGRVGIAAKAGALVVLIQSGSWFWFTGHGPISFGRGSCLYPWFRP